MEKLFLEFRRVTSNKKDFSILDELNGKTISIASTVQYLNFLSPLKEYLESKGKKVILKKGAFYQGQIIGCKSSAFDSRADVLLLLADGKFHAMNSALILNKEIFIFNLTNLEKISFEELKKEQNRIKAKKIKFLSSNRIGLIVSNKSGQIFRRIEKIVKRIEKIKKEVFLFETDIVMSNELENFSSIELWINTACCGIQRDNLKVVNLSEILEFI